MEKKLIEAMPHLNKNIELSSKQRIKTENGINWLEERQSFKTISDGRWHRVWVRIGIVE